MNRVPIDDLTLARRFAKGLELEPAARSIDEISEDELAAIDDAYEALKRDRCSFNPSSREFRQDLAVEEARARAAGQKL